VGRVTPEASEVTAAKAARRVTPGPTARVDAAATAASAAKEVKEEPVLTQTVQLAE
jgi:hypothetical protein